VCCSIQVIFLEGQRKTTEIVSRNSWCSAQASNRVSPEYKSENAWAKLSLSEQSTQDIKYKNVDYNHWLLQLQLLNVWENRCQVVWISEPDSIYIDWLSNISRPACLWSVCWFYHWRNWRMVEWVPGNTRYPFDQQQRTRHKACSVVKDVDLSIFCWSRVYSHSDLRMRVSFVINKWEFTVHVYAYRNLNIEILVLFFFPCSKSLLFYLRLSTPGSSA
jgi:hypothetical protein